MIQKILYHATPWIALGGISIALGYVGAILTAAAIAERLPV